MKTSLNGINLIKSFEGCRLTSYKCPSGVWTIGYGHTNGVYSGMTITESQAIEFLKKDLSSFESSVNRVCSKLNLNQNEFDALVSFTYNCGEGNLSSLIKNRTKPEIADALLLYNKGNSGVLPGLVRRRQAERELFLKNTSGLPYYVEVTASALNIRKGPGTNFEIIDTVPQGTILTVWAEQTVDGSKWGKDGDKYFNIGYTKR